MEYKFIIPNLFSPKNDIGYSYFGIESRSPLMSNNPVNYVLQSNLLESLSSYDFKQIFSKLTSWSDLNASPPAKKTGLFPGINDFIYSDNFLQYTRHVLSSQSNTLDFIQCDKFLLCSNRELLRYSPRSLFRFVSALASINTIIE